MTKHSLSPKQAKEIESAFGFFDRDNSGQIDLDELSYSMEKLGYDLSYEELIEVIDRFDNDHNGQISFPEFVDFFKSL